MNLLVSLEQWRFDYGLDALRLEPGLSSWEIVHVLRKVPGDIIVGSHKWIESTELVELNEQVVWGFTVEARDVATTEDDTGNTEWEEHVHRHFNVFVVGLTVTGPDSTVALTA